MSDDLYPVELRVSNLYCFKGPNVLELDATVYAILAEADDNPQRSNWLGKSTLLMAFAFALYGWHTKRTDDEIVTKGETEAKVTMELNDGSRIERWKTHGKSMQIRFYAPGAKVITQARAQEAIDRHVGFNKDEFFSTCFFEQKKIGALVSAGASERSALIEGWLADELEPIQLVHGAAVKAHRQATADLQAVEQEHRQLGEDAEALMVEYAGAVDYGVDLGGTLDDALRLAQAERTVLKVNVTNARAAQVKAEAWDDKVAQAEEFEAIQEQGIALKTEFDALPEDAVEAELSARTAAATAKATTQAANTRVTELSTKSYKFDGNCPLTCEQCPTPKWVKGRATSKEALASAIEAADAALRISNGAAEVAVRKASATTKRARIELQLVELRARATPLIDVAAEVNAFGDAAVSQTPDEDLATAEREEEEAGDKVKQISADIEWLSGASARMAEMNQLIAEAKVRELVAKEAVELTGRSGAQQAVQELVMSKVERRANVLLSDASIPLQVRVTWDQETKGLAKVCPACGTAFPTSQRVKSCAACGAVRGPNTQRKLAIAPSRRSGAAEDLAGIAMGIAASQWLRARRGARWAAVFIDEPFGSLDAHNRQALGSHITAMLKSSYASAFVVAHERAILSAMPGRINIRAGADWSRIEGIAA